MISSRDRADLERAKVLLEKDSAAVKLAAVFGDLAEKIVRRLPRPWRRHIEDACLIGLDKSWEFSATTVSGPDLPSEPDERHRQYAILSGALGGVGIVTLFAELPVTTVIIMRAVADIAKSEGEDFRKFDTRIACLQVFALRGSDDDTGAEATAYYASRTLLAQPLDKSSRYIAKKGAAGMGAPFAVQIVAKIAAHYQTWLSARTAAAAVPLAGALMGAGINIVYLNYLQDKARGHFIVRRLERKYGAELIEREYIAAQAENRNTDAVQHIPDEQQSSRIIRRHAYASLGSGLLPIPLADFILVTAIQFNLLKKLSDLYGISFSENRAKNLLGILVVGTFSSTCGIRLGASIAKLTPVIGYPASLATASLTAGASTYAVGKVFNRHFAQGGTFLSFDPKAAQAFYAEMFAEGKDTLRSPPAPI